MKTWLIALSMAVAGAGFAPSDADARRLGGGKAAGMQRQAPPPKPADTTPATPAAQPGVTAPVAGAAAAGGTAAAAAAGSRSWLAPVAGIAAGLGIAALMSHLGMGEAFANLMTVLLLALVGFFVLRWALRRFAGRAPTAAPGLAGAAAGAGGGSWNPPLQPAAPEPAMRRDGLTPALAGTAAAIPAGSASPAESARMPEGFDEAGFVRVAKMIFIRLQAANDAGQVDDLRKFTTPELFASLRLDLQERAGQTQQTDVLQLEADVVDTAQEDGQWIVSVRFHGLVREESEAAAQPFDELWHLVKPVDGSREWAIAGITPQS